MRNHKVRIKGRVCEALATAQPAPPEGQLCGCPAVAWVEVGGVRHTACWTHEAAARNPERSRPLQWRGQKVAS